MKVGKATSDWNVMKRGCPQGSSFGPTLWNLYQNDLSYHINEIANLNMYADDHQMYIVGSDMSIMCTNMEKEGNSALKWHKNNYLLSNPEKLNAMHVVWLSFHCWCHASVVIIVSRFAHTGSLISYGLKKRKFWHWQKNARVYRVVGMIASIRGKKPHVYRLIILKQMSDHSTQVEKQVSGTMIDLLLGV